jgi:CRISPR-associated protein Cmr5
MHTRDQRYAVAVYERVTAHKGKTKPEKDKYGTMAQKLPVLIQTAGLAQAVTFLEAKSKKDSERMNRLLLEDLASVVAHEMRFGGANDGAANVSEFTKRCREADLSDYLLLTRNTLAALLWFKRFSVSVLGIEENANVK